MPKHTVTEAEIEGSNSGFFVDEMSGVPPAWVFDGGDLEAAFNRAFSEALRMRKLSEKERRGAKRWMNQWGPA